MKKIFPIVQDKKTINPTELSKNRFTDLNPVIFKTGSEKGGINTYQDKFSKNEKSYLIFNFNYSII